MHHEHAVTPAEDLADARAAVATTAGRSTTTAAGRASTPSLRWRPATRSSSTPPVRGARAGARCSACRRSARPHASASTWTRWEVDLGSRARALEGRAHGRDVLAAGGAGCAVGRRPDRVRVPAPMRLEDVARARARPGTACSRASTPSEHARAASAAELARRLGGRDRASSPASGRGSPRRALTPTRHARVAPRRRELALPPVTASSADGPRASRPAQVDHARVPPAMLATSTLARGLGAPDGVARTVDRAHELVAARGLHPPVPLAARATGDGSTSSMPRACARISPDRARDVPRARPRRPHGPCRAQRPATSCAAHRPRERARQARSRSCPGSGVGEKRPSASR